MTVVLNIHKPVSCHDYKGVMAVVCTPLYKELPHFSKCRPILMKCWQKKKVRRWKHKTIIFQQFLRSLQARRWLIDLYFN